MNIIEEVNETLVKLTPSATLVLELTTPAGQSAKFKTNYIGFMPEMFILLQHPDPNNKNPKFTSFLQNCAHCTVRGVVEGHEGLIVAFQTKIKAITTAPIRMLVLAIPLKVAVQHLRKVIRLDTDITVEGKIKKDRFSGTMLNLSPMGCLVDLHGIPESFTVKEGEEIVIKVEDERFACPGKIIGTICNIKKQHLGEHIGVKFSENAQQAVSTLINQTLFPPGH